MRLTGINSEGPHGGKKRRTLGPLHMVPVQPTERAHTGLAEHLETGALSRHQVCSAAPSAPSVLTLYLSRYRGGEGKAMRWCPRGGRANKSGTYCNENLE